MAPTPFTPALLIIDMQNDFIESGSLAVPGGRALVPHINTLLSLPFALKLASRDWHPPNHQSFAPVHNKQPFEQFSMTNTSDPSQTLTTTLWPPHCVQDTSGAEFAPGLQTERFDVVVSKGTIPGVETYSCISDIFGNKEAGFDVDVAGRLRERGVTHAYVVGLAGDFCVRHSALDLRRQGFETLVLGDCTEYVDEGKGKEEALKEWMEAGVKVVSRDGEEVGWVREMSN